MFVKQLKVILITFMAISFIHEATFAASGAKRFSAGFAVLGGQGKMGNGLDDATDRDMTFVPVQLFFGLRLWRLRVSAATEYNSVTQSTDPAEVNDINLSGTGIAFGPRLEYYDGKNSFGAFYRASESYKLAKTDINNIAHEYKATGGFTVQYTRRLKGKLGLVIDFSQEEFSESLETAPVKWNRAALGLIISNFDTSR